MPVSFPEPIEIEAPSEAPEPTKPAPRTWSIDVCATCSELAVWPGCTHWQRGPGWTERVTVVEVMTAEVMVDEQCGGQADPG